jgi:hypothetical protein
MFLDRYLHIPRFQHMMYMQMDNTHEQGTSYIRIYGMTIYMVDI